MDLLKTTTYQLQLLPAGWLGSCAGSKGDLTRVPFEQLVTSLTPKLWNRLGSIDERLPCCFVSMVLVRAELWHISCVFT